ncbi:short transient receptor potential channel 4-associated protein-like [Dendronephthya gigantea]|uniref:short transient receptor potential channel 4-associated protein-like n=1 Tax=Dendronephthya gigantea TaxID=151771 RepID=UPI00106BCD40|nr:short transient receptor potential channel 4-associated protein-like [Dendronephthya gigantea]
MSRRCKSRNILHAVVQSKENGHRFNVFKINPAFFELLDKRLNLHGIPKRLTNLEKCCTVQNFDVERCSEIIKGIAQVLFDKAGPEETSQLRDICTIINDFSGPEILIRILCYEDVYGFGHLKSKPTDEVLQNLYSTTLDLLHNVNCYNPSVARILGFNDHLVNQLFSFLKQKETYVYASHLLDDILRTRSSMLSLQQVDNLPQLVSQMNDHQLANFCRVLYFVLTDATETCEDRNTLLNQDTNKRLQEQADIADNNQKILLSITEFLPRVCTLASESIDKSSPFVLGATRLQQLTSFFSGVLEDITDRDDGASILHSPYFSLSLKFFQDIMLKVEALFVLCVLLTGTFKTSVQEKLASLRLIPKLCIFFDELNWTDEREISESEDCHCAQESALKIQFLRLLHSFCDHHDKKYLLLTPEEQQELKGIYEQNKLEVPETIRNCDRFQCCEGEQGLLTKTLDVLRNVPQHSSLRFWLSRALEGFLRGKASYADQIFLIKRGLLKLLVQHICSKEMKTKEVLQSSFDLLGELMKFNYIAFKEFNEVITEVEFDKFILVMTSNVVDSNMFMRCLILSNEHFASRQEFSSRLTYRLIAMVSNWKQRVYLLHKLIMSVSVETLTQENVSCLNTALVFLMFALDKGYLPLYLKAFRSEEAALKKPGFILDNLRSLLKFWKSHYLTRGKDCSALEQSSCISIRQWRDAVDILLQEDVSNPKAVVHYISGKVDRNS